MCQTCRYYRSLVNKTTHLTHSVDISIRLKHPKFRNNNTSSVLLYYIQYIVEEIGKMDSCGLSFAPTPNNYDKFKVKGIIDSMNTSKSLVYFNLERNTFSVEAAQAIGKALKKHPELQKAIFKDIFTGRLKTEITPVLQMMCSGIMAAGAQLTVFDCSDNAIGPNGITGLLTFFRSCYTLQVTFLFFP